MHYVYKLMESTIITEDGIVQTAFGIAAYKSGDTVPCRAIPNIFTDRGEAESFIRACNVLGLDIDHLDDVIYDVVNI